MSKGLEALNSLKSMACVEAGPQNKYITYAKEMEHNEMVEEKYNIIEKELKVLEMLKKYSFVFVEKGELKSGKYADIELLLDETDFENQEEYELLKEVLEDE